MKTRRSFIGVITLLSAALIFSFTVNINAQNKDHRDKAKPHEKGKKEVVVKHHNKYREVVVKDRHYFYREGYFYNRGPKGYVRIAAPMGARITLLPHGYKIVRVHRLRYYVFGGIYYRFLPHERVYVVVRAPL
jgi:Family of unknown function (DUF6515)